MTGRVPCPAAPGPLEGYAARFDDLFGSLAQRRGFREYLAGLLAPRDRNKTLTALAGAEPVTGAQHPAVQRLQFFLSELRWDPERVDARRLELLRADPATAPHDGGVLVIDDSGDRKDGTKTAHVGRQWLGRCGKTDSGVVTRHHLWADERIYYPVHAVPCTPARHFPRGKNDPGFRTKLAIGAGLAVQARAAGFTFRAVVADSAYGDQDGFPARLPGMQMHANQLSVHAEMVRTLVNEQFPQWRRLPARSLAASGTVNAIFRIGERLAARPLRRPLAVLGHGRGRRGQRRFRSWSAAMSARRTCSTTALGLRAGREASAAARSAASARSWKTPDTQREKSRPGQW